MKKGFLSLLMLLLLIGLLPVHAQEIDPVDLPNEFVVEDLRFTFDYPEGWVFDVSDGIALAESQADLTALLDEDDSTSPTGYTLRVAAVPTELIGLETNATLDDTVTAVAELAGLSIDNRVPVGIMGYRTVVVFGTNADGRRGSAAIWQQGDLTVLMSLGVADDASVDDAVALWVPLLQSVTPIVEDTVVAKTLTSSALGGISLLYPAGWVNHDDGSQLLVVESQEDLDHVLSGEETTEAFAGLRFSLITFPREEVGDYEGTMEDIEAVLDLLVNSSGGVVEVLERNEYMVLDQPAIGYRVVSDDGNHVMIIAGFTEAEMYIIGLGAPGAEAFDQALPIFQTMLQSLAPAE